LALKRLTAEFGMGSGLIAWQKSPGRRKTEHEAKLVRRNRAAIAAYRTPLGDAY
jgi:hypothetical protein